MEKCCAGCCHNVVCWQESRIRVMCCQRTGRWIREEKRGESGKGREREKVSGFNDTSVCVVVGSGWLNARSLRYRGSSWCLHMRRCNGHALTTPTHSTWTFLIMRFECDSSVTLCEWRAIVGAKQYLVEEWLERGNVRLTRQGTLLLIPWYMYLLPTSTR